jgi:hypothetical protein
MVSVGFELARLLLDSLYFMSKRPEQIVNGLFAFRMGLAVVGYSLIIHSLPIGFVP